MANCAESLRTERQRTTASDWLEKGCKLLEAQADFRRERSAMGQVFLFNRLPDNQLKQKKDKAYVAFMIRTQLLTRFTLLQLIELRGDELTKMLKFYKKWADLNEVEVNVKKMKIMVFCRSGRRKLKAWFFKDTEIQIVS